jgi:spoIIIJ-associated protein
MASEETPQNGAQDTRELNAGVEEPGVGGAATTPEKLLRTKEVLGGVLERMGVQASIEVRDTAEAIACRIDVQQGEQVLDGLPRAQVLEALQHLVNRIVNREGEGRKTVTVDVGAFRQYEADPAVAEMARRLGDSAKRMGKVLTVVPIHARDRKTVHLTLAGDPAISTRSEGEGTLRRLVIESKPPPAAEEPHE